MDFTRGAAIFCQKARFLRFLAGKCGREVPDAAAAAEVVRQLCGVQSRRELNTNKEAARKWAGLVHEFNQWTAGA